MDRAAEILRGGYCIVSDRAIVWIHEQKTQSLSDYKIHCFNGKANLILVCKDRFSAGGLTEDFYDRSWNHLPIKRPSHGNATTENSQPCNLQEMLTIAEQLTRDMPFGRVDFYESSGRLYFGEITIFPTSGFSRFIPEKTDLTLGEWININ